VEQSALAGGPTIGGDPIQNRDPGSFQVTGLSLGAPGDCSIPAIEPAGAQSNKFVFTVH